MYQTYNLLLQPHVSIKATCYCPTDAHVSWAEHTDALQEQG